jgi:outer membrane protein assembly factor BamB
MLWQSALGTGNAAGCHYPVSGNLYCIGANGQVLYAFNATSGSLLWKYSFASSASILSIANGIVYAQTNSTVNGHHLIGFHAFAAASGTLLWTTWVH